MKKILLINGAKKFSNSNALLNKTLHNFAKEELISIGKEVTETIIDAGYNIDDEIKKINSADAIIYQMPSWWMGEPWIVKKYIDDVYTAGAGIFYENDGRSRSDLSKKYGSGGLLLDKKYMISVTWNAPLESFIDKEQFFEGFGVDGVYLHFHKLHQFMGMRPLDTFICNDVVKNPQIGLYLKNYKTHLHNVFKS